MPWTSNETVSFQQGFSLIVEHSAAVFVDIRSHQISGASVNHMIRTTCPIAARTCRTEQIIVTVFLVDICCFHESACKLFLGSAWHNAQSVIGELYYVNSTKRTPNQIVLAAFFNKELVDGILYSNLITYKHSAAINKRTFGTLRCGNTNAALPFNTPHADGIIEYVLSVDVIDVGRPHHCVHSIAFTVFVRYIRIDSARTSCLGKGSAHKHPVY